MSTGFVPFDLVAPAKESMRFLYPSIFPLRPPAHTFEEQIERYGYVRWTRPSGYRFLRGERDAEARHPDSRDWDPDFGAMWRDWLVDRIHPDDHDCC